MINIDATSGRFFVPQDPETARAVEVELFNNPEISEVNKQRYLEGREDVAHNRKTTEGEMTEAAKFYCLVESLQEIIFTRN